MQNLTEFVPEAFRKPMYWYVSSVPAVLGPQLSNEDPNLAMYYVQGAMVHQEMLNEEVSGAETKVFKITVKSVDIIERRSKDKNFLVGKKATITYLADNGDDTETMDTPWIEYHGWDRAEHIWEIALGNTIAKIAEDNIGKQCFLRKIVHEVSDRLSSGGNKVRFVADLMPIGGSSSSSSVTGRSEKSHHSSTDKNDEAPRNNRGSDSWEDVSDEDIYPILDDFPDETDDLGDDDVTEIRNILNRVQGKRKPLSIEIAEYVGIKEDDKERFNALRESLKTYYADHDNNIVIATVLAVAEFVD